MSLPVGIIGAGPAGATLARLLAEGGLPAVLIDEREPHEKPCGGGVTVRGYREHPVLAGSLEGCALVREAELWSGGSRVGVPLPEPVRVYPRSVLNRLLFEGALAVGAGFVRARARGLWPEGGGFRIDLAGAAPLRVSFLAGADGAAGISRKLLGGGRGRARFALAAIYHAERPHGEDRMVLGFPPGLPGYLWTFPRPDHLSVGICSREPAARAGPLAKTLEAALAGAGLAPVPIPRSFRAFPIPDFSSFEGPRSGPGWALIGDAGGFVDPLTLEGISHAMRSAELLAAAILDGRPERFEADWRADFGRELRRSALLVDRFYRADFPRRMVRAAAIHPRVRAILGRLLCGQESYRGLFGRVARALLADRAGRLLRGLAGARR